MAKQELSKELAQQAQTTAVTAPKSPAQTINEYLMRMMPEISRAIPKHMTADRLARIALTAIRMNADLLTATLPSLAGAVMQAAQLGLEPNLLGQCYFVPFKNRKKNVTEVQFIIGYKGYIELFYRSGLVETVYANAVHENDDFEYSYGTDGKFHHKPAMKNRGAIICYYAFGRMKDGAYNYIVMSIDDINKYRDKYSKSAKYDGSIWKENYEEMAKKTCIRRLADWMPKSPEIRESLQIDTSVRTGIEESDFIPEYEIQNAEVENDPEPESESQPEPTKEPASKGSADAEPPADFFNEPK